MSFPVTAFLRPLSKIDPRTGQMSAHNQCVLELYDPLSTDETVVAGQRVPLESDLTTPLAYFLSRPEMNLDSSTLGLLRPEDLLKKPADALKEMQTGQRPIAGLYMVQPYEPGKIPVLMVHGLWSSPMTWMEMFNDLRSQPEIREHYQFWFYLYPTAQPFWSERRPAAPRPGQGPRDARSEPPRAGPGPNGADRPQHGRAVGPTANAPERRRLLAAGAAASRWGRVKADPQTRQKLRRDVLLPAQPVDPPRGDDRHAAPRQHVLEPNHAMAAGQADQPAAEAPG